VYSPYQFVSPEGVREFKMLQLHRREQQLPVPIRMLICSGFLTAGSGIVALNVLFSSIPLWIGRPALILLIGLTLELLFVSLVDYYSGSQNA
jgi:hypothetical protein